ncbi:MAG: hypothetical protein ACKV2Q_03345 [Planctomycetaceae bacterium]
MPRIFYHLAIIALLFAVFADSASAQYGGSRAGKGFANTRSPISRPTISPYLNLLRQGNPALNYYGLVRPEQEFRAANVQFQNQFNDVRSKVDELEKQEDTSNLGVTGHQVRFLADQTGGSGSVRGTLSERDQRSEKLPPTPGSRIAPTGHGAYFINHGTYYPFPNR